MSGHRWVKIRPAHHKGKKLARDPERIDGVLVALRILWKKYPDLRLGQLIKFIHQTGNGQDAFYVEDDEWLNWTLDIIEKSDEIPF